ncbi:MAG: FAD-dependent oxidoreductase [Myxococcota bacterium]|nr:FAD-dependent oxidoreductase [Myxococcota bacterium]MEE2673958.1 FAD-dependent oxidoreductase [Myxococcota bacterium]
MSEPGPLSRDEREIASWDVECDLLVVGFGIAGACAAIEGAQAGMRVLVLERAGGAGGTSAMSGGLVYLGGGTPIQKACGFEDSPEEMFKYMMAACGPDPDAALIGPYCEGSVEHFHWLVDKGIPFRPSFFEGAHEPFTTDDGLTFSGSEHVHPFNEIARPAPRGHIARQVQNKGSLLMRHLITAAESAGVATRTQHRCDALVTAGDGCVVGAIAASLEGDVRIRALRGVVLTTGGFIWNREMVEHHAPLLQRCKMKVGTENDDGLGIRLGLAAGGEAIRMEAGDISLAIFPPNQLRQGIFVNRLGQRFLNEDAYMGRAGEFALLQQDGRIWLIVDDDVYAQPELAPLEVAAVGETIAELEAELGLPTMSLQHTVAYYNRHAERGDDPLLHKGFQYLKPLSTPPFAALDVGVDNAIYSAFTLGGLRIDADGAVLQASGAPVPGLFAAGRSTSGIAKQGYSSGMSLGDGSFFGRRAGRRAARGD